ncbi:DNA methyltransferase [Qipengyuania atrilutea]|uniref:DNA methyltransferase n=1 Tax=Qipengyuania atrilutea TaxID=2744473 RepID=UPI001C3E6515|nr:DNA methyltransferase [Actirhodobacter atriluteus]
MQTSTHLPNELAALEQRLGPIEYREPNSLKLYAGNPRKHPEKQIVKLMASISHFGFALPLLVDEDEVIIAGEARAEAAKRLGLAEVPVIVASHWSKAQVRAYRLADNKLGDLSHFDLDELAIELAAIIEMDETPIEILGWETAELDVIFEDAGQQQGANDPADEVLSVPVSPAARSGDLWLLGAHRLLCGSSLEAENWARLLDGQTPAMAFSDAPFNVPVTGHVCGLGKTKHAEFAMASGEMSKAQFTGFLTDAIGQMAAPLKDGGVLTLAMDWRHSSEILAAIEANSLTLLNMCVWNKASGGMGSLYRSKHELFWIARKGKTGHTNNVELGKHGRYRTNVWDYAGVNSFGKTRLQDLADHPTVKPLALVADAIRDVTHPGEIVIDGFLGSGTTLLAAERTRRRGCGIEIEPGYIDVAIRRWEKMTGCEAVLASENLTFAEVAKRRNCDSQPAGEHAAAGADMPNRSGRALRLFHADGKPAVLATADPGLVQLLVRAREWWARLSIGKTDIATIAREEKINDSWISRVVRLNFLAPAIVDAILSGSQPVTVTAATLRAADLPTGWDEQLAYFNM